MFNTRRLLSVILYLCSLGSLPDTCSLLHNFITFACLASSRLRSLAIAMLSRFIAIRSRHLRFLSFTLSPHFHPSPPPPLPPKIPNFLSSNFITRHFSAHQNGSNNNNSKDYKKPTSDTWTIASENENLDDIFSDHGEDLTGISEQGNEEERQSWLPTPGIEPWRFGEEEKMEDVFGDKDVGGEGATGVNVAEVGEDSEMVSTAEKLQLEKEEQTLMDVLKGPNRAFGDLVAASGITDAMLDSLIALKNFQDIDGLPPLTQIEDERYEKSLRKSTRAEIERQKQEEAAKARVRQVDEKGRAYGTGKRKCSVARVWIQPGEGKFSVNDKEFDVYFPMLDHRAALLRPFAETKTLGLWDVKCTVKGGGVSGQVDAIRLGISRALQSWEPGLRPPLREAGFLTRDSRVVERKKPGKAKARKSFQWVKR